MLLAYSIRLVSAQEGRTQLPSHRFSLGWSKTFDQRRVELFNPNGL